MIRHDPLGWTLTAIIAAATARLLWLLNRVR